MRVEFFTSAFCEPCMVTRSVLAEAGRLVPAMELTEHDVVRDEEDAGRLAIRSTPTVIVTDAGGAEVFRAEGIPSLNQVLAALARAV